MNNQKKLTLQPSFRTMTLILSEDQSKKFTRIAKENHLCDGILMIGKGTVNNHILNIFGLKSQKRIVVNTLVEKERTVEILNCITEKLKLHEPNHGIAYTTAVSVVKYTDDNQKEHRKDLEDTEEDSMFKKLTVIVNRGMADDVMDIARRAGVKGGTILHGRGTGSDCAAKLFGIEIEPEKELIMIIVPSDLTEKVMQELFHELKLDVPGNGILFLEPVWDVRGLFESSEHTKQTN